MQSLLVTSEVLPHLAVSNPFVLYAARQLETYGITPSLLPMSSTPLMGVLERTDAVLLLWRDAHGAARAESWLAGLSRTILADKALLLLGVEEGLPRLWSQLCQLSIGLVLQPVLLSEPERDVEVLDGLEKQKIEGAVLALRQGVKFCRQLRRERESLALADCFHHAPLLI